MSPPDERHAKPLCEDKHQHRASLNQDMPTSVDPRLAAAVRHFWQTRRSQGSRQGTATGNRDRGSRTEVTGGKHLDGFTALLNDLLMEGGLPDVAILRQRSKVVLPGFFRPTKQWDLLILVDGMLLGTLELKAHVGSFGNNANNRAEEALGNATDLWAAYRNGAFRPSPQPWLGYLVLVEEAEASTRALKPRSPHFAVFEEFDNASYIDRYKILCTKLVRERLYSAACLIVSNRVGGLRGLYREPSPELSFANFVGSLRAHALGHANATPHWN
ncbi:MAG TPA: PaeR7I family type II restriction endonuclease [Candidatus Binatia bacterium]|nr:PaeR7I family type II restriction endonuclease [Candidatus Binatia bacterium]